MPLRPERIRAGIACGPGADGRWHCGLTVRVLAEDLRPLGLHPDQPTSRIVGPSPPAWWHAEAERRAGGGI